MKHYMLDTSIVSHIIKANPKVIERLLATPMTSLCISAITEGEILFGLAKRPDATRLHLAVREFLRRVDVLPWDGTVAAHFGKLRAETVTKNMMLGHLDLLIAAHAMTVQTVLVTNNKAFNQISGLQYEDWTQEQRRGALTK